MHVLSGLYFLPAQSLAAQALAQTDWSAHPLRTPAHWPAALQTHLAMLLRADVPMILWWGAALHQFANDAFFAANEAPWTLQALGQPAQHWWRKTWPLVPVRTFRQPAGGEHWDLGSLQGALAHPNPAAHGLAKPLLPLWGEGGTLRGAFAVGTDAQGLGPSSRQLADVLENMTDGFFMIDSDWTILACNSQHERVTKIPREQQLGRNFLDIFLATPEMKKTHYYQNYCEVMQTREPRCFEDYYPPLDLWTACHVYPTPEGGIAVFCRNTTSEKKAVHALECEKQKFEAMFSHSPAGMALLRGQQLVVERCNARFKSFIGDREVEGKELEACLTELQGEPYFELMREVLKTGERYVAQEQPVLLITEQGHAPEVRYHDFTYTRIESADGEPYGIFIQSQDVSSKVAARMEIVAALKARDELLSICSHELKTPVASMKLSTQLVKRGLLRKDPHATSPERVARMVDQSDRQLDRLLRLIEEMLDFSQVRAGKMKLEPHPCDLSNLLSETLERLRPQVQAAGASIEANIGAGVRGDWDAFRIEQLLTNLLTNALKYGEGKPIFVTLEQRGEHVHFQVRDQGPGIERVDQERIFLPYERAISATCITGLGLGLYISRKIVEAHGGQISVRSKPGDGATFAVELPLQMAQAAAQVGEP